MGSVVESRITKFETYAAAAELRVCLGLCAKMCEFRPYRVSGEMASSEVFRSSGLGDRLMLVVYVPEMFGRSFRRTYLIFGVF